ncbi:MAG TPA: radical SAM protein [Candidatus Bathyarchaeia archaeon]|nr:radical SAM protein [Candidatus Bathyarchaeia archaeon]
MKILLVNPPVGLGYYSMGMSRPPLGLAYMAALLTNHQVTIVDFNVTKHWKRYPYGEFDLVGVSADTARYSTSMKIARLAKAAGATIVLGGPHVSFFDEDALRSGAVDYIVRNEGEYAFRSLVRYLSHEIPIDQVGSLSYMADGAIVRNPNEAFITDLDSLPFPARDLLHLTNYTEKIDGRLMTTMITSRGCPFNCNFCSSSQFSGVRWRPRTVDGILSEIELIHRKYGYRAINFIDDNFTLNPDRAAKISQQIIANGFDLRWEAMSHVETVVKNPAMVKVMARAGLRWMFMGFESGSQEILNEYGKKSSVEDARRAVDILHENGVKIIGAFILGALGDNERTMRETIRFAKSLNPSRAQFSLLTPYPGTKLFEKVRESLLTKNWEMYSGLRPTIRLDKITPQRLNRFLFKAYAGFYLRPPKAIENYPYILKTAPSALALIVTNLLSRGYRL